MAAFRCTTTTPPIALRQRVRRALRPGFTPRPNRPGHQSNARFAKEGQSFLRARSRIFSRAPRQPEAAAELHVRFPAGSLLDAHNSLLRAQKFPAQARREFARKPLNILAKVQLKTSSGQESGE